MAAIQIDEAQLTVVLGPLEQFAAVHQGDVIVALDDIERVDRVEIARAHVPPIHFPGLDVPGVAKIGKFVDGVRGDTRRDKVFAATHGNRPGYVITTRSGEPFRRIVVSLPAIPELDNLIASH